MFQLLGCWKGNAFDDSYCKEEIQSFMECVSQQVTGLWPAMQAFSGDAQVPGSRLIEAAMLDLQNLRELGKGERGAFFFSPSLPPPFSFSLIPTPLVVPSTLPNLPLFLKSKTAAILFTYWFTADFTTLCSPVFFYHDLIAITHPS